LEGDQFFNPERVKLKSYKNKLKKLQQEKKPNKQLKEEMTKLKDKIKELDAVFTFYAGMFYLHLFQIELYSLSRKKTTVSRRSLFA